MGQSYDLYIFSELPDGDGGYSDKQKIDLLAINMATYQLQPISLK